MQIYRIPALADNYIFLLHDPDQRVAAVVDPAEVEPVLLKLQELDVTLVAIYNTHHHRDHVGANRHLLNHFPSACVYAGDHDRGRIPEQQVFLNAGDQVEFADRSAQVLFVPGHTRGHIAYYFPPVNHQPGELFCGDTLFAGGCGRLFEETPEQMVRSLNQIRTLPDNTRVWCAHEYTLNNLKFALTIEPENHELRSRLAQVQSDRQRQEPTIPSNLGLEKRTNPFLRWDQPAIQKAVQQSDDIATFAALRQRKDQF
jgi:hydroxyacylglutathione hydrolase